MFSDCALARTLDTLLVLLCVDVLKPVSPTSAPGARETIGGNEYRAVVPAKEAGVGASAVAGVHFDAHLWRVIWCEAMRLDESCEAGV
jgi:hypothetical protein